MLAGYCAQSLGVKLFFNEGCVHFVSYVRFTCEHEMHLMHNACTCTMMAIYDKVSGI